MIDDQSGHQAAADDEDLPDVSELFEGLNKEQAIVTVLFRIIKTLGMAVEQMTLIIGEPELLDPDTPRARYRYKEPNAHVLQVLMCVRIASGLRAAGLLLLKNHTTETNVLFRTIDDFASQIQFVQEIIEKGIDNVTVMQREYLEKYFLDDDRTTAELLDEASKGRNRFNSNEARQKQQAAEARYSGGDNPHRVKTMVKAIDDSLSGAVHGSYGSVMEMYLGLPGRFQVEGIPEQFVGARRYLGRLVHLALNMFFTVAANLGHVQLAESLRELRREFEKSMAYTE